MRWACLAVVAFIAVGSPAAAAEPDVVSVEVEGLWDAEDEGTLPGILGIEIGTPVDRVAIRRGLQTLIAGGEIAWAEVETDPAPGGVAVRVRVDIRPTLASLSVRAPTPLWKVRVSRWLDLAVGDPVDPERVAAAAARVRRRLVDRGYPEASVEPYLEFDRASNTAAGTVEVRVGAPLTLGTVAVDSLPEDTDPAETTPSFRIGRRLTRNLVDRLRDRVEEALREQGWWESRVVDAVIDGGPTNATLRLVAESGDRFRMEIEGDLAFREEVREALPDPVEEDLHPTQIAAFTERLNEELRARGWPLAAVYVAVDAAEAGQATVTVRGSLGTPLRVEEVRFPGAIQMRRKDLERAVRVRDGSGNKKRPLTRSALAADRARLEDLYRRRGFVDVIVRDPLVVVGEAGDLVVEFAVDEGLRWVVDGFRVEGLPAEVTSALDDEALQLEVTEGWDPRRLEDIEGRWVRAMTDAGYPEATVASSVDTSEPGRVRVVVVAEPGAFVRIGEIAVAGLRRTSESVVRRMLNHVGLVTGEPYSQATLIRAQQMLYELGLFRRVTMVPVPGDERRDQRGLVVQVEEGLQRSYLVGVGWDTEERFRFTLGWSHLNLFGGAHAVSLETRQSARENRYQFSLREALLPVVRTPGYFAVYQTDETFAEYRQQRRGVWLEIGDRRRVPFRRWVRYEFQIVRPDAPNEVLSQLEREDQEIEISSITPAFEWDTRDDLLNPTQGTLVSVGPEYAFPTFSAKLHFVKVGARATHYLPMPFGKAAIGVRAGGIWNLDEIDGDPPNLQLPLAVRYFAGGRSTHRAFPTDRLGIRGQTLDEDGTPLGGNAVVLVNLDVQRRIWGGLAAVVFFDGGNVWASPDDVRFEDFRWGAGAGLRYDTPAGPFRIEYGHKLDRREGESDGEWFFSFGVAF
jgi:outer membrane protein insertion porin family